MGDSTGGYTKVAQLRSVEQLRERLEQLEIEIPLDDNIQTAEAGSPLAETLDVGGFEVGNRWCILPM